jgi:SAM-dependent methyltransferase
VSYEPSPEAEPAGRDAAVKAAVREFWNQAPCGEVYARGESERERYAALSRTRYELEPYLPEFARFAEGRGKDVLEIGVGMGCDHVEWARAGPRSLTGVDLTPAAIAHSAAHLAVYGLASKLQVADAENLPFPDASFDLVYSWGVLHHTPDTPRTIQEVHRVLRPGGLARVMIYHTHSLTGYLLWARYGLLAGRPLRGLGEIYRDHLESPGTQAFTRDEARAMFSRFADVDVRVQLNFGDLLEGEVGQRHRGPLASLVKAVWPRPLIRRWLQGYGLMLLIEARK